MSINTPQADSFSACSSGNCIWALFFLLQSGFETNLAPPPPPSPTSGQNFIWNPMGVGMDILWKYTIVIIPMWNTFETVPQNLFKSSPKYYKALNKPLVSNNVTSIKSHHLSGSFMNLICTFFLRFQKLRNFKPQLQTFGSILWKLLKNFFPSSLL